MKRLVLLLFGLLFFSLCVIAQDNRVLKSVELKNGSAFAGYVTRQQDGSVMIETTNGDVFFYSASEIKRISNLDNSFSAKTEADIEDASVFKKGSKLFLCNTGTELTRNDFMDYYSWTKYKKASKTSKVGWTLFGIGCGFTAVFVPSCIFMNSLSYDEYNDYPAVDYIMIASFFAAVPLLASGATCLIIGNSQLKKIKDSYNHTPGYAYTINFGVQQNGIGLALNF